MTSRTNSSNLIDYPKAGQSLLDLSPELMDTVLGHSAQWANVNRLTDFISWLRDCEIAEDFNDFQRLLFKEVYEVEERRGECSRIVKRLERGGSLPANCPRYPENGAPLDLASWKLELFVYERLARQLRTVGDALAWKCFKYDRRKIIAFSMNSSSGPMHGKIGLPFELGRVEYLWNEKRRFGLLHDITNCLRIGDITEFAEDGTALIHEVKKSALVPKSQLARLQIAIEAIEKEGPISIERPGSGFAQLREPHLTNLKALSDLIQLSKKHGCRGMKLGSGRAVTAFSLLRMTELWGHNFEKGEEKWVSTRRRAIHRAGLESAAHHMTAMSLDTASRATGVPPLSIYPFTPEDCAHLISDLTIFDVVLGLEMLVTELEKLGMSAKILFPNRNGTTAEFKNVMEIFHNGRSLILHSAGMHVLLFEFLEPETWAKGILEIFTRKEIANEPVMIFSGESSTWERATNVQY